VEAALHARYASSPVGQRSAFEPGARSKSKITAVGTIGTTPAGPTGNPRPRSRNQRITPSAAPRPYADPPVRRIASIWPTRWRGWRASSSRVPVARPRRAQAPRIPPSGASTTVHPVARARSVQCPTLRPRTAVREAEEVEREGEGEAAPDI